MKKLTEEELKQVLKENREAYQSKQQLILILTSVGNPDHGQNPKRHVSPPMYAIIKDYEQGQAIVEIYITRYELGGGNWTGGKIFNCWNDFDKDKPIARISYNRRVWDMNEKEITTDPDKRLNYFNELNNNENEKNRFQTSKA